MQYVAMFKLNKKLYNVRNDFSNLEELVVKSVEFVGNHYPSGLVEELFDRIEERIPDFQFDLQKVTEYQWDVFIQGDDNDWLGLIEIYKLEKC